jgi:DNA-binding NarL/FixJ family response regulator
MMNVLIAEDNSAYRESLHHLLSGRFPFMQITETADGADTLHQALSRQFDLIFMDIRLPQGNGLDLTRAIKAVFVDSIICVITSYDLPEYRDVALRNGADRFVSKGDLSNDEIATMVETLLQTRFRTLLIVNDTLSRAQLSMLLHIRWPAMIVAEAENVMEGVGRAATLKPNLVLLDLSLSDIHFSERVQDIKAVSAQARLIGMTTDESQAYWARAIGFGVEHCVSMEPAGHTELVTIVNAMQQHWQFGGRNGHA